jgi:hypothetical protein
VVLKEELLGCSPVVCDVGLAIQLGVCEIRLRNIRPRSFSVLLRVELAVHNRLGAPGRVKFPAGPGVGRPNVALRESR